MRHVARTSRMTTLLALATFATACGGASTDAPSSADKPALFATLPPEIQRAGVLRNGADFTYPPLEFTAGDGANFTGVDFDLAEAVSNKLGLTLQNTNSAFGTLIP